MNALSASAIDTSFDWRWKPFDALTAREVYALLAIRSEIFVVEQRCVYLDIDGADLDAWHLGGYDAQGDFAGYLRVLPPDPAAGTSDVRIGRVLTARPFRGVGLGRVMMAEALARLGSQWPDAAISLHAQAHLQPFYRTFGFLPTSDIHDEDGIAHIWMRRA